MNKKALLVTVLASSLFLSLGSCSKNIVTSRPTSSTTGAVATKISVAALPDVMLKGDVLDLDQYVTVLPAGVSWTLENPTSNISVDGHKITLNNYGDFKVTVSAGSNKKLRSVNGNIISSKVKAIRDYLSTATYNYTTTLEKDDGTVVMKIVHNANYFVYYTKEDDTSIAAEGLLLLDKDSNIYRFTIGTDGSVSILPGILNGVSRWHDYYGAFSMPIVGTQIIDEVKDGTPTEKIVMPATAFDEYNMNNLTTMAYVFSLMDTIDGSENGTDDITNANNVYSLTNLVLDLSGEGDSRKLTMESYGKDGAATGYRYTISNIGDVSSNEKVATAAQTGAIPPEALLTEIKDRVDSIKTNKNFTIEGKSKWLKIDGSDTLSSALKDQLEGQQATYNLKAEVSDTTYHAYDLNKVDKTNDKKYAETVYQLHNGAYYKVVGDTTANTDGTVNVLDTYKASVATELKDKTSLSDSKRLSLAGITDALLNAARYSQRYEIKATASEAAYVQFSINNDNDSGNFAYALNEIFPLFNDPIVALSTKNGELAADWYTYTFTTLYLYADKLVIKNYENIDYGESIGKVRYNAEITLSASGTTTASAIDESKISFPA